MSEDQGVLLERKDIFQGRVFGVTVDRVRLPHGSTVDMEVVRHPGSVILVPMPDPDRVVLVRQFRYVIGRWIWELPAGSLDPGEDPIAGARRECREEIGLDPARIERLGAYYPSPGFCTELMMFYKLTELGPLVGPASHDEDEQLEPKVFELEEARRMVERGEIVDMKTALGFTLL